MKGRVRFVVSAGKNLLAANSLEATVGIAEFLHRSTHRIEHRYIQIAHRLRRDFYMAAWLEASPGMTGDDHRQVAVTMAISVGQSACIHNHRVVEQRSVVHVFHALHTSEKVCQLFRVKTIDLG